MPVRNLPLVNDQYYHILNRGVEKRSVFTDKREYSRMLEVIDFYRHLNPPRKFSLFLKVYGKQKTLLEKLLKESSLMVTIHSFVLMPNHFHFLLRQEKEGGISKFIKNICDSYTRYFNTRQERVGPLFQGQFKAVLIESDEQLLHLSRYIHLNPYSSYVIKSKEELLTYPLSSLPEYLGERNGFCETKEILSFFKHGETYKDFVLNQADYQRKLENIKHLILE